MTAAILDGRSASKTIQAEVAEQVRFFRETSGVQPCLATVLVGEDPASQVYVRNKHRTCQAVGMKSEQHTLPADIAAQDLISLVHRLNADADVHGILVQLPLPSHIDTQLVLDAVDPLKDVDAFSPANVGLMLQGRPRFLPCTPHGIVQLLHRNDIPVAGKHVVVVGRSDIVGKPIAAMLVQKESPLGSHMCNATVTICHSRSQNISEITKLADILIVAIGKARAVDGSMIRQGAVVIDVGINRVDEGLVGDVDFQSAAQVASAITPVPGGVGPLTIAMLMDSTLTAAKLQVEARS